MNTARQIPARPGRAGRDPRAGLSLVEVILALAILGMGLAALVATTAQGLGAARKATNYEASRELLGRVELEDPVQNYEYIEDAAGDGDFEDPDYRDYRWVREVEPVGLEEDALFQITTRVSWVKDKSEGTEEIVTYLHAPTQVRGRPGDQRAP